MRDYSKLSPQFWIGKTGKALRKAGPEAQVVALYLLSSPHANMLGLYWLPELYLQAETGLGEGALKGLQRAIEVGFCKYDPDTEMVWVVEMAEYQIADHLEPADKRCKGVQKDYDSLPENPFLAEFYERYASAFHMTSARGIEGASKPHASQKQEQEQEQEQEQAQEQEQEQDIPPAARSRKKPQTLIPDGFADGPSERVKRWAAENQFTEARVTKNFTKFVLWARSKGQKYSDWDAALMTAIHDDWAKVGEQKQDRHNNFSQQDYHAGVSPDGTF